MANNSAPNTGRVVLRDVGKCIYCFRSDVPLSEEHIIPFGLNGNLTLLHASCETCRAITSAFEFDVLRHTFLLPRRTLHLRSRRPQQNDISAIIQKEDSTSFIEIPVDECPIIIALPIFLPPAILDNRPVQQGIQGTGTYFVNEIRGIAKDKLRKKHGGPGKIKFNLHYQPVNFARMLAKIAYGFAVANFGIDDIEDLGIISAIKGETDDIGKWVGNFIEEKLEPNKDLHSWNFQVDGSYDIDSPRETVKGRLTCKVRLFSLFGAPEYTVVVGKIKNLSNKFSLPI